MGSRKPIAIASLSGTGRQLHVRKLARVLQALNFFGHHGDQDVLEAGFGSHRLVFSQAFHCAGTRNGAGYILRVDTDSVQAAMYVAVQELTAFEQDSALRCFLLVPVHLPGLATLD